VRVHYLQHVPFENLASMQGWFARHSEAITGTHFYRQTTLPPVDSFDWLVIMGGPMGVADSATYPWLEAELAFIREAIDGGKTVLGICLGAQLIAAALGAWVGTNPQREIGWFPLEANAEHPLATLLDGCTAFHWHGDSFAIPPGAMHLASSEACRNQAFALHNRVFGLQFHLETTEESARALLHHCGDELDGSRYVQSGERILADSQRFAAINGTMTDVLELIAQLSTQRAP
jgi:GMP synthase-like glutamine amidotransferase